MKQPGSTLLPPTDLPPVGFDPDGDDDGEFEQHVPRPASIWRIYIPRAGRSDSGFYGEGYWIPDAFPTRGDAEAWLRKSSRRLLGAKVCEWSASDQAVAALSGDNAA